MCLCVGWCCETEPALSCTFASICSPHCPARHTDPRKHCCLQNNHNKKRKNTDRENCRKKLITICFAHVLCFLSCSFKLTTEYYFNALSSKYNQMHEFIFLQHFVQVRLANHFFCIKTSQKYLALPIRLPHHSAILTKCQLAIFSFRQSIDRLSPCIYWAGKKRIEKHKNLGQLKESIIV